MAYNPNYKWINPTYPIYNWGYNPLTKWDEPPSSICFFKAWISAPTGGTISSPRRTPSTGAEWKSMGFPAELRISEGIRICGYFLCDMFYSPAKKSQVVLYIYISSGKELENHHFLWVNQL